MTDRRIVAKVKGGTADGTVPSGGTAEVARFSMPGPIFAQASGRFLFTSDRYISDFAISLDEAGSSDTVVQFRRNGSPIVGSNMTLGSGVYQAHVTVTPTSFAALVDYMTFIVVTAGVQAMELNAWAWGS